MWQLIAGLLGENDKMANNRLAADAQKKQDTTSHIMQNRQAAQTQQPQKSANFGNVDIGNLINGVFSAKTPNGGTNWRQYA
jgi:hypothetical protein